MKDTKHIRRDFYSVPWVMPQGSDFGVLGCPGGQKKKFQTWSCGISSGQTGDLGVRSKVKYHQNSVTMSISKIFIPNFVCVLTNERYKTSEGIFIYRLGHAPGVGLWGTGGQSIFFQTWSCSILNQRG